VVITVIVILMNFVISRRLSRLMYDEYIPTLYKM